MRHRQLSKLDECRDCVCLAMRTATRRITQGYDSALAGTGLRVTQFSLLVMVHHPGAPTMKTLARMLDSDPSSITRNIQALSKRQLLTLSPGQALRERRVILTNLGRPMLLPAV